MSDASEWEKEEAKRKLYDGMDVVTDALPRQWYALFMNCMSQGFTKEQAMELLKVFILGGQISGVKCT